MLLISASAWQTRLASWGSVCALSCRSFIASFQFLKRHYQDEAYQPWQHAPLANQSPRALSLRSLLGTVGQGSPRNEPSASSLLLLATPCQPQRYRRTLNQSLPSCCASRPRSNCLRRATYDAPHHSMVLGSRLPGGRARGDAAGRTGSNTRMLALQSKDSSFMRPFPSQQRPRAGHTSST